MNLDPQIIEKLYVKYGYRQIHDSDNIRFFLYEKGRYYGADIIPLDEEAETLDQCIKIKSGYQQPLKKRGDIE